MQRFRSAAGLPAAILSVHSHSDRSFLDDRELALLSGILRDDGIENDLVVAVIRPDSPPDRGASAVEARLIEVLSAYDPIVYERVWSPQLIARLRQRLPGKIFIGLRGEHLLLDSSAADIFCDGDPKQLLGALVRWLRAETGDPPAGVLVRRDGADGSAVQWDKSKPDAPPARAFRYAPNLRPRVINPEALPASRTFSIMGNEGCPFQLDARANPIYAGTSIPARYGRGCAFCTTGNHYEGRPNAETAESVLEQIRYVRAQAPEYELFVLKDQNPFGYLTEVIERCQAEGLSGFALLLETRAEWFLRNAGRFDRALAIARRIGVRLAPFLVGIENFSQPELDRFNKGTTAAANIEFLDTLWAWKERYGEALDLGHTAFGFILFSPWTTLEDLVANYDAIRRTNFDRLRGSVLLSRARLYPDTALYYLAERDGLLADEFDADADDASRRYGYYPSRPWRHLHPEVAHFAALATRLAERNHSRDMVAVFGALLAAFRAAGEDWRGVTVESVARCLQQRPSSDREPMEPATEAFQKRFARLVQPLAFNRTFAGGWRFGQLSTRPGRVQVELQHDREPALLVEIVPHGRGPHFRRSRHYDIRSLARECSAAQHEALTALSQAIADNDT